MKSLTKNKPVVYAVILFALAIIAYNYLWKSSMESTSQGVSAQSIGNDVLSLNASLQAVTLDQSVFSSPEYKSLTDWAPTLAAQTSGRTDPFAPIGQ